MFPFEHLMCAVHISCMREKAGCSHYIINKLHWAMSVCMVHIYTAAQNARNTDRSRFAAVRIKMLKLVNSTQPTRPIVDWLLALVAVKWSRKLDSCQLTSIALEIRVRLKFNYLAVFFPVNAIVSVEKSKLFYTFAEF